MSSSDDEPDHSVPASSTASSSAADAAQNKPSLEPVLKVGAGAASPSLQRQRKDTVVMFDEMSDEEEEGEGEGQAARRRSSSTPEAKPTFIK